MKINYFLRFVCKDEAKKKQVNIAQIAEIFKVTRKILREKAGVDIYEIIKAI
jgi:hypothetical protein